MKRFVTADPHFGNDAIIQHCNRPFKNASHMDKQLIRNFNSVVSNDDDLYIVGDVSLRTSQYRHYYEMLFQKLNGRIHIIAGNHEVRNFNLYAETGAMSFHHPYLEVEEFVLCHDPALSVVDRNRIFLVGHIHDLFKVQKNCINVGVDVHDYKPISFEEVREIANNISLPKEVEF